MTYDSGKAVVAKHTVLVILAVFIVGGIAFGNEGSERIAILGAGLTAIVGLLVKA